MSTETAVLLAAGRGSRMRRTIADVELTADQRRAVEAGQKGLVPMRGRPFLEAVVGALEAAGVRDVCLVTAPDGVALRRWAASYRGQATLRCVVQQEPRGTADALLAARHATGRGPFLVLNSDTYYPVAALTRLGTLAGDGLLAVGRSAVAHDRTTNLTVDRLEGFALVEVDATLHLRHIDEKPSRARLRRLPDPLLFSVNGWRFDRSIHRHCSALEPSPRGELELPAAALATVESGRKIQVIETQGVLDLTTAADVPVVERLLPGRGAR